MATLCCVSSSSPSGFRRARISFLSTFFAADTGVASLSVMAADILAFFAANMKNGAAMLQTINTSKLLRGGHDASKLLRDHRLQSGIVRALQSRRPVAGYAMCRKQAES
eukprot:TRINITY_DN40137_c0_g1_i1.p1 TRINITY_DN40137_c0_g1~~TRINITY_DN40137_c0_g1_i1.p1  ORF type:complete len:109 (-),score=19.75 TRINITY_DN40137_c0_g1_i1:8-334(-)